MKQVAHEIRCDVLRMYYRAKWGHLAPALSCVDILTAIYFGGVLDAAHQHTALRDRVILSKGHGCAALYAVLARAGYFPRKELATFYQYGSIFTGLANAAVPGVEVSTGSLGHGASFAVGTALAAKRSGHHWMTYAILGDGELQEGAIWEAAMMASAQKLGNLVFIVDANRLQASDFLENILTMPSLSGKWKAFGWEVAETDGNDADAVCDILQAHRSVATEKPFVLIARTVKGKGVAQAENRPEWHSRAPQTKEAWQAACADLGMTWEELTTI